MPPDSNERGVLFVDYSACPDRETITDCGAVANGVAGLILIGQDGRDEAESAAYPLVIDQILYARADERTA